MFTLDMSDGLIMLNKADGLFHFCLIDYLAVVLYLFTAFCLDINLEIEIPSSIFSRNLADKTAHSDVLIFECYSY